MDDTNRPNLAKEVEVVRNKDDGSLELLAGQRQSIGRIHREVVRGLVQKKDMGPEEAHRGEGQSGGQIDDQSIYFEIYRSGSPCLLPSRKTTDRLEDYIPGQTEVPQVRSQFQFVHPQRVVSATRRRDINGPIANQKSL